MSGERLFKRTVKVTCWRESIPADPTKFVVTRAPNSTEITDLRIQFKIDRSLTRTPNTADVIITNLADATRADLEKKPLLVQIDAGYDDLPRLLYVGDMRFAMTKLEGPDWETLLQLGDGDCHHRWSRVSRSYGPGTSVRTMLKNAATSMGLELPAALDKDTNLDKQFAAGAVSHGPTRDELTRLLAPLGYTWSIQNGRLQVLADNQTSSVEPVPIDEDHGMIGTPQFGSPPRSGKPPHMTVKNLLYPELSPGGLVKVKSKVKSGLFKIVHVRHDGDSHGEPWYTEVEIQPVETSVAVSVPATPTADDTARRVLPGVAGVFGGIDAAIAARQINQGG